MEVKKTKKKNKMAIISIILFCVLVVLAACTYYFLFIKQEPKKNSSVTIEILAGTWTGEKNISKIVILRGGRGFIIFTNGASMNINVSIDENSFIHIKQTSSSNASFYPELPRKNALEIAPFAKPIEWILQYNDDDSLSGIKNTITLNQNQDPVQTEIKVLWARKSPF